MVAVGLERAHAKLLSQSEGLPVVGFGLFSLRRLLPCCNLAEEPQGIGFVAPLLMRPGELQGPLRLGASFVQAAGRRYTSPSETTRSA